jgi:hypothetical protein
MYMDFTLSSFLAGGRVGTAIVWMAADGQKLCAEGRQAGRKGGADPHIRIEQLELIKQQKLIIWA